MRGVNRCLFRIHWTRRSRKAKQDAVTAQRNLEAKNRELGSLLEEASWASFNQAERQFHLGQWNEGIALLARAVKFDPKNQIASERFFQQLILDRWKVTTPLATLQDEGDVTSAVFSPDGARILTLSRDKTARLWDATVARSLARLMVESQALRQVGLLSELASGFEISQDGSLTAIPSGRRFELITQVRDSAKDDELMSRYIRWFCSPIEERTIFPDSKINNATWLDNQIVSIPGVPEFPSDECF